MIGQTQFIIFLVLLKCSYAKAPYYEDFWVIWNVGQGQWVTHIIENRCLHYDMGGEINTFKNIRNLLIKNCASKENEINLSHWDLDHYSQIDLFVRSIDLVCWQTQPSYENYKKTAQKVLKIPIRNCTKKRSSEAWIPFSTVTSTNDSSIVHYDSGVLTPGDSTIAQEKFWINGLSKLSKTKILILGHHGSRTSTGVVLLKRLPNLKMAIASARFQKYKHPHQQTINRLRRFHFPMIKTEDWGNIWFKL